MALKLSTGMRNHLLDGGPLKDALASGSITVYEGTPPATADEPPNGTLLATVSPVSLGFAENGVISKDQNETWLDTVVADGTAQYFRFCQFDDTGLFSSTDKRIQGTCGTVGTDMLLTSTALAAGAPFPIDACNLTMPTF
jgi:hypothetical protein